MLVDRNTPAWNDGAWTPLPALDGDASADVCVVGVNGGLPRRLAMNGVR
jgi:hypothetical protein